MARPIDVPPHPPSASARPWRFLEIVPPGTQLPFVRFFRPCVAASLALIALCATAVPVRGVRLGVDFAGGYQIAVQVAAAPPAEEAGVRAALARAGIPSAGVTRLGAPEEGAFQIRFPAADGLEPLPLVERLERELGVLGPSRVESVDFVGPRIGEELRASAFRSLAIAFALILAYVAFRFTPAYAPGAVLALVHDVLVTAGLFVLLGWEFDLDVVAALLTLVGYSLNDTIVVYDRIRENRKLHGDGRLAEIVDLSLNETLSRTLLTAGTTLLALLALLLVGGPQLRGFALAMTLGVVVGTYSCVYVAAPLVLLFGRRAAAKAILRAGSTRPARAGGRDASRPGSRPGPPAGPGRTRRSTASRPADSSRW